MAVQPALPSGTVTFLFTDIEDSTRLWEDHTAAMEASLERHDDIVRAAIDANDGHVFSTAGDAISAAFARVSDAVDAAVEAQRVLGVEQWADPVVIRVRMGVHSGEAQERDGDYFGPVVNRAARIMSVGHGGQVLVSAATAELLADAVVELRPVGEVSLRGLGRPEAVAQVVAEGLVEVFPPPRAVTDPLSPNNLPLSVDAFVGRDGDLAVVVEALSESRLVTLTGVGGCGKTRLALEAAAGLLSEFVDGVWLVELAPLSEPAAVPFVVGAAVGLVQQPDKSMLDSLASSLVARDLLLIFDNCEHLLQEVADLVSALESRCPGVKVLATSREGLGLRGERLLAVSSLPTVDAVELFVSRAEAVGTDVGVANESVLGIVERLDGLPLAIELAAARTRGLSTRDIEHRLAERFRLLRGGRGRADRHQTLWNTVDWSYQLLEPVDRLVFDRLSMFAGGFTLQAAIGVCSDNGVDEFEVEDAVLGLVERSMVVAETSGEATRYRLLETLRQFGEAQLGKAGHTEDLRVRHARWYSEFAREAGAGAKGADGVAWSKRMRAELDNYRAVVYGGDAASARRVLASLEAWPLFWERFEFIDWALAVIEPPAPDDPDWIGTALWAAYGVGFVARRDDIGTLLGHVDPDMVPAGMLSYMWSYHQIVDALMRGDDTSRLLRRSLDVATTLDNEFDRLWATSYVTWQAVVWPPAWIDLAAEVWDDLADDAARNGVPTVAPMFFSYQGVYLASIRDAAAYECLEAGRRASIECGNTIFEHAAVCYQIPLLIERGDLGTARRRAITIISQQLRSGSHLMLQMALPGLVLVLDETGHRDAAQEIWAELRHRAALTVPADWADIETRLGPPGEPRLDDDQLAVRTTEVLRQLELTTP